MNFKKTANITGWIVFALSLIVYFLSAERFGSLWDCGEFIAGAYKLQVVHPPGAPFFILVGRMFTWIAEVFSNNPADIAFAVNLMSGVCTAFMAMFVCWIAMILSKMALIGRDHVTDKSQLVAFTLVGAVAGFTSAFASSIWFSAVEGEVYAMSTFFTALVIWLAVKWYHKPLDADHDRLLVLALYCMGLSIGVHLLSLLTMPVLALLYYWKKYENHNWKGMVIAGLTGVVLIGIIQKFIISGIPFLWSKLELWTVNGLGMPFHSGVIPLLLIFFGVLAFGIRYSHKIKSGRLQTLLVSLALIVVSYMSFGVVLIRANANTPINMNNPDDAFRILPYLNREQYGERPLLFGPDFNAAPSSTDISDRYGRVGDGYEIVDRKLAYEYRNSDKRFFPRLGHNTLNRPELYKLWLDLREGEKPSGLDNLKFFFRYQIDWMYNRYFMWNFVGRQNGEQGHYDWDSSAGNWKSGIKFVDEIFLHNLDEEPSFVKNNESRNHYYFLPLIFGILGILFHYRHSKKGFIALLALFIITGLGIIVYSNQPPSEPRERDYVLAASFFTFAIWVGMGVMFLYEFLKTKIANHQTAAYVSGIALVAPLIMLTQNFDDHSRRHLSGAVDYASNFLESCDPNAIIFTYGDNDTYPLWYAQEVQGIRTDVRVVNLSLLQVDWYINQLRRKVNDSPPIKMTIPKEKIRGFKRNQLPINTKGGFIPLSRAVDYIAEDHPREYPNGMRIESVVPSAKLFIPVNKNKMLQEGLVSMADTARLQDRINLKLSGGSILKDQVAMLDILANNFPERPIYWAVTVRPEKLLGLGNYLSLEGLALKLTPLIKNKKDGFEAYSIYGMGTMNGEKTLDIVKNRWKWGGFDKHDMYVDDSFGPSIQSMRMVITRAAENLIQEEKFDQARELITEYLKGFPNMNHPYNQSTLPLIISLFEAKGIEEGKEALKILASNTAEWNRFVKSLSPEEIQNSFRDENELYMNRLPQQLPGIAAKYVDQEFGNEIKNIIEGS